MVEKHLIAGLHSHIFGIESVGDIVGLGAEYY